MENWMGIADRRDGLPMFGYVGHLQCGNKKAGPFLTLLILLEKLLF